MNGKKSLKKILDRFCCCSCCRHFLFSNFQTYCNTIVQQHFIYFFSNFDSFFFSKFCLRMVDFFLFSYYKYIILFRSMLLMMMIPRIFFLIYPLTPINDCYWLNFFSFNNTKQTSKVKKEREKTYVWRFRYWMFYKRKTFIADKSTNELRIFFAFLNEINQKQTKQTKPNQYWFWITLPKQTKNNHINRIE